MYISIFKTTDPYFNLAAEEYILASKNEDFILLWQNDHTIVVGRHQNTAEEIDGSFVEKHGVRVVRRNSGGGAVYHDLGNLNYTVIRSESGGDRGFSFYVEGVRAALSELGVTVELSGRNDLTVEGLKVSGVARYLRGSRIMYHGTLLFDSNLTTLSKALTVHPEKFASKSVKSVRARVGNIRDFLKEPLTMDDFIRALSRSLTAAGGLLPYELTAEDIGKIEALKARKYDTFQWNYGISPPSDIVTETRFPGGALEVRTALTGGLVKSLSLRGDFLSLVDIEPLEEAFTGIPYERRAFADVLNQFDLPRYLGGITAEEFLQCVFNN